MNVLFLLTNDFIFTFDISSFDELKTNRHSAKITELLVG